MSTRSQRLEVRVTEAEKKAWAEAAGGSRRVSEWLRSLANEAVFTATPDKHLTPQNKKVSIEPDGVLVPPKELTRPTGQKCPRWTHHRAGVYCGTCQKVN